VNGTRKVCALTGASGYVGGILRRALEDGGWNVVTLSRGGAESGDSIPWSLGGEAGGPGNGTARPAPQRLEDALRARGVSALVHAAWDLRLVRRSDLERVNVQGSMRLFAGAKAAGLDRLVFISSISSFAGARSDYGQTKLAVESAAAGYGGVIIRPGLVYGSQPGGMFGALKQQAGSPVIPMIGNGSYPQYLVHEEDLASAVLHALSMNTAPNVPVTVANSHSWPFSALISEIARSQGKSPRFAPVPWQLIYTGLKTAETIGLKIGFRSDSVLSLVYQNPRPVWNASLLGVEPRPFTGV
jgi:nucleoside-diphosphate-sugar epimerase